MMLGSIARVTIMSVHSVYIAVKLAMVLGSIVFYYAYERIVFLNHIFVPYIYI